MSDHLTPQEIQDSATAGEITREEPRRRSRKKTSGKRPGPRMPGLQAALEAMEAEDAIVRELCGPEMSVSAQQAATAVELARRCASTWVEHARRLVVTDSREPVYQLHEEDDFAWLDRASMRIDARPDDETMTRLEAIINAIPFDSAALASLNAAKWLVTQHEMTRVRLH